ncbi:MAG: S-layer homology domain-containing protein [bacterium]
MRSRANTRSCAGGRATGWLVAPRFALLAMLVAGILAALATTAHALSFSDVTANHPYATAISDLASRGVISGFADGTFRSDTSVNRQQFAKMIVKTLGFPVSGADTHPFTDVPDNRDPADPFYPNNYVAVCYERGLTEASTPTTFGPFDDLSRAQLITLAARATDLPDPPAAYSPPFGNFSPDHYSWARKAAYAGLLDGLQGMGPSFDFFQSASRGECAQVLHNLRLLTQPSSAGATASPSVTLPAAQAGATTWSDPGPVGGATTVTSLVGSGRIFQSPYALTGICVVVLATFAAVLLVVRRARSAQSQNPHPASTTSQSTTQEDAQAILRDWEKQNASPAPLPLPRGRADVKLWDELADSAQKAQAAKDPSAGVPLAPVGSDVERARTEE